MNYDQWIGREVEYTSASGKRYTAVVHHVSEDSEHDLPTVSLSFELKDRPGKRIVKHEVPPKIEDDGLVEQTWQPLSGGRQLWEKRSDGKTYFCDLGE